MVGTADEESGAGAAAGEGADELGPPLERPVLVRGGAADAERDPGARPRGIALRDRAGQRRPQPQDRLAGSERDLHGLHQGGQPLDRMVVIELAIDARIGDEPSLWPEA